MQRIAVIGCGGAGKSTFARELGRRTGLPVVHLDEHYWRPGWVPTPSGEWRYAQEALVAGDRWIVDGNYSSTFDVRFARADTVIVLARSRWACMVAKRRCWWSGSRSWVRVGPASRPSPASWDRASGCR